MPGGGIYAFHLELRNSSVETGMETFADGGALECIFMYIIYIIYYSNIIYTIVI